MHLDVAADCRLVQLEEGHAEELYALVEANRGYLAQWLPWAAGQTLEGTREFIAKTRRQVDENDGFQGALVLGGRMVGAGGFLSVKWESRSTELGYWLAEDQQGRGLMTKTVSALVDHAFGQWRLNRVEIHAGAGNRKSRAIPERLGFQQEGVLRDYERVGDRYIDIVVYSLLASDR
jgi:ribosomal-protein-serine acetyltransferase